MRVARKRSLGLSVGGSPVSSPDFLLPRLVSMLLESLTHSVFLSPLCLDGGSRHTCAAFMPFSSS